MKRQKKQQALNKAILFTRLPIPGVCKTRLESRLSGEQCAGITKAFIQDELDVLNRVCDEVVVYYDLPEVSEIDKADITKLFKPVTAKMRAQVGGNIFEKMSHAFKESFSADPNANYILVGSDIPMLDELTVIEAFRDLDTSDVVIRKSPDGGYFLIGLRDYTDAPFSIDADDGAEDVASKTIEAALSSGLTTTSMTIEDVFDIDTAADLETLVERKNELLLQDSKTLQFLNEEDF